MARRLKHDVPGRDWRVPSETLRCTPLPALFAPELVEPAALVLEIGFGRGEFLLELSGARPRDGFLGVELSHKRVVKLARRLARSDRANVRLVEAPAEYVLGELLPAEALDECWINFPDPWPKKRHHRRRLIQPALVRALARALAPGGRLELATDHAAYADWIHEVFAAEACFRNRNAPLPFRREVPGRSATAYELQWRREGRALHFFSFERTRVSPDGGAAPTTR